MDNTEVQSPSSGDEGITWLSSDWSTVFARYGMPLFAFWWCLAVYAGVAPKSRRFPNTPAVQYAFAVGSIYYAYWMRKHVYWVGHRDKQLIICRLSKRVEVPFHDVSGIETRLYPRGKIIEIRFKRPTELGLSVCYIPPWSIRVWEADAGKELREAMKARGFRLGADEAVDQPAHS
jgi:hypothetical protein